MWCASPMIMSSDSSMTRCQAVSGRFAETVGGILVVAASGKDKAHSVRPLRGSQPGGTWPWQAGDLSLFVFTMICGQKRTGGFQLQRTTRRDRMQATLQRVKGELQRRRHKPRVPSPPRRSVPTPAWQQSELLDPELLGYRAVARRLQPFQSLLVALVVVYTSWRVGHF